MEGCGAEGQWVGARPEDSSEPGPSSKRPREEDEDVVDLLDQAEALELVEFDPKVKPSDPAQAMLNFLEKLFNKALTEEEREVIKKISKDQI